MVVSHNLAVVPTINGDAVSVTDDMELRNYITVDYYNVRVRSLTAAELGGTTGDAAETTAQQDRLKMGLPVRVKDTVDVTGSGTTDTDSRNYDNRSEAEYSHNHGNLE